MIINEDKFPSLAAYPQVSEITNYDVLLRVPEQYYGLDDLKALRKLIKKVEQRIKENAGEV